MTHAQFKWVLAKGIDMNLMICLLLLQNAKLDTSDIKVKSWILLLKKHQLIAEDETITEKGELYIAEFNANLQEIKKDSFNFDVWCEQLHEKLRNKLLKLTGKSQVRATIRSSSYSFLCNSKDLNKKLKSFIKIYKTNDYQKIEKTLLRYIETCHKSQSWFPLMEYYILKDSTSKLATDLETIEEEVQEVKPRDTKNLF